MTMPNGNHTSHYRPAWDAITGIAAIIATTALELGQLFQVERCRPLIEPDDKRTRRCAVLSELRGGTRRFPFSLHFE